MFGRLTRFIAGGVFPAGQNSRIKNKAVNPDAEKDVLAFCIEHTEGAKFWLMVVNELKASGLSHPRNIKALIWTKGISPGIVLSVKVSSRSFGR